MSSDGGVDRRHAKPEISSVEFRGEKSWRALPGSRACPAEATALQSRAGVTPGPSDFRYRYGWNRMGRKGQACAVLARGKMNSCLVQFEDGYTAVTSRNALRRRKVEGCQ
jgi:hypothetical protein